MLYYNRIDVSEGIDTGKTSTSRGCDNSNDSHSWYFLDKDFKFQPDVCNSCHDVLMMSMNLSNTAVLNIHRVDYPWNVFIHNIYCHW